MNHYIRTTSYHRYPFIASEILSSDLKEIIDMFFIAENPDTEKHTEQIKRSKSTDLTNLLLQSTPEFKSQPVDKLATLTITDECSNGEFMLLEKLLRFLDMKSELNPVLVGYFSKVFSSIIDRQKNDVWKYLMNHKSHMERLFFFASLGPIAEILARLLKDDYGEITTASYLLQRKETIIALLKNPDKGWNVVNLLIPSNVEAGYTLSEEGVKIIFEGIRKGAENTERLETGMKMLIGLIDATTSQFSSPFEPCHSSEIDPEKTMNLKHLINYAVSHMSFFKDELRKGTGSKESRFGITKLAIIDWLLALIKLKNDSIRKSFAETDLIMVLIDLIEKHYTHTMLHARVCKIVTELLTTEDAAFVENIVTKSNIAPKLLELYKEGRKGFVFKDGKKQLNKQYIVFVTSLCGTLNNIARISSSISEHLKQIPYWKEFTENELKEIQKRENTRIGESIHNKPLIMSIGEEHNRSSIELCPRSASEALGNDDENEDLKKVKVEDDVSKEIITFPELEEKDSI